MTYAEIKELFTSKEDDKSGVFFAFDKEQFKEGMAKIGVTDTKLILSAGGYGLYGTKEGLDRYFLSITTSKKEFYKQVKERCTPQQVYDYEWANHECGVTGIDTTAYEYVVEIFGKRRASKEVERK